MSDELRVEAKRLVAEWDRGFGAMGIDDPVDVSLARIYLSSPQPATDEQVAELKRLHKSAYSNEDAWKLVAAVPALIARLEQLTGERDRYANMAREITCVWCGHQFESTLQSQAEHLYAHAKVCEKHPLRKAEAEVAACLNLIPANCRIVSREGGGPENLFGTLALSVNAMASEIERLRAMLRDCSNLIGLMDAHEGAEGWSAGMRARIDSAIAAIAAQQETGNG